MPSGVQVILRCGECGAVDEPRISHRWAPESCLELRGGTRFYVDGEMVRCPEHTPSERERAQRFGKAMERLQESSL